MKCLFTLLAALLLASAPLRAEQIFVLFDGTCGDRVLYEQAIAQQPRLDYYAYHFPLVGGDRLMLETGAEGATVQSFLPQNTVYCGDPRLSVELAARVNGGVDRVFVLLPTANNQFLIQPVVMAAVFQRQGERFSYTSPLTSYQFDAENGIIGENLAMNTPGAKVYFEGRDLSPCAGYFMFRQLNPSSSYPVIDYRIAPEIGLVERRLGSDGKTTSGGVITAKTVNGVALADYLASVCGSPMVATTGQNPSAAPLAYSNQPVYTPPSMAVSVTPQPESSAYSAPAPAPIPLTHTVAKGETLYAISRNYATTVDAIKAQNGLTSNTLFPGQQLTVMSQPSAAPTVQAAPTALASNQPAASAPVALANPGAPQPTPYNTTAVAAPQAYGSTTMARSGEAVYGEGLHTVQPGETVASLALKYGYTSAKFREMNELGPNDVVKVGERLKTSDCNCPTPEAVPAPQAYGNAPATTTPQPYATPQAYGNAPATTTPQPYATPQAYGNAPATTTPQPYATPQAYGNAPATTTPQPYATPQAYGSVQGAPVTASGATTPAYRAPQGYQAPALAAETNPMTISNDPNFGQPVANPAAAPTATMGTLESRGNTDARPVNNPSTYGAYPAPLPSAAPAAAPPAYGNPPAAPTTYGSTPASPNTYGTPVGANVNYGSSTQPSNRSFHLVQEGESLYSIARRYNITTDELRTLNGLKAGDVIVPFQKLYVN
ncbi:LysM peptidoglycan-binding domain-containing protein [Neolewinella lacunae]|uniref:LysM peptidoglycan-binding domain-containing protein n=1 Tax=Neolewinella lacunae TaxID=1517758 RepID=A0A923PLN7_9BACT|nr:LysM peptidoglycan-binding domain-containing protein [Neolewinella lacunae]MBC6993961.1 LysM peptidoglycan-binding domain-containing protein [Neolewinella lacunae]MDN3634958.1 LysM peptidoglycan-binding domain-containing protein [Neolewinella lacunae]